MMVAGLHLSAHGFISIQHAVSDTVLLMNIFTLELSVILALRHTLHVQDCLMLFPDGVITLLRDG